MSADNVQVSKEEGKERAELNLDPKHKKDENLIPISYWTDGTPVHRYSKDSGVPPCLTTRKN
jgi:hypothetical protein